MNYFQDREMSVKWNGSRSASKRINGGGPQGATLGILEYLAQSNNNADCVDLLNKFKFIDDLTMLEVLNLLTIGLHPFNLKNQVPSDIPVDYQYIDPENLQTQKHLDTINEWTKNQKMLINAQKTKAMVFNFTKDYQFATRLSLENSPIEVISHAKLLGTIIQDDLKWDLNTANIVKKANSRMELLKRVASFGAPIDDLKKIYVLYVRSVLEHSSVVWHSSLTDENSEDLERVQKSAMKIILGNKYMDYRSALNYLQLDNLHDRRQELCERFAQKCLKNENTKNMFPLSKNQHTMKMRNSEKYHVQFAKTSRLKNSPIIYMQNLLNGT